jgi:hypothetical protein
MGYSGFYELERPGEIYHIDMENGRRCTAAFSAGGKKEVWKKGLAELQTLADQQNELNWEFHFEDGTIIRAHQQLQGQKAHRKQRH